MNDNVPASGPDPAITGDDLYQALVHAQNDLAKLLAHWHDFRTNTPAWRQHAAAFSFLAERFLSLGALGAAQEVISVGFEFFPGDVRLRQLQGLAWARGGAIEQAQVTLEALAQTGQADVETLGLLARTYKDQGLRAVGSERTALLNCARDLYAKAFRDSPDSYWTGINAAALTLLLGDAEAARQQARAVRAQCLQLVARPDDSYWPIATLGETALIDNDLDKAESWYAEAVACAGANFGDIAATQRQARLLLQHLGHSPHLAEQWLPVPKVGVFVGHMIDRPGRPVRFPPELEQPVRKAIERELRAADIRVGYASAASGADILFHEVLRDLGGESRVVLPYDAERFAGDRMNVLRGADWKERFQRVLDNAVQVVTVTPGGQEFGGVSYEYANRVLEGLALVRARELATPCLRVAVWDGQASNRPGDVGATVDRWRQLTPAPTLIRLNEFQTLPTAPTDAALQTVPAADPGNPLPGRTPAVRALLFADGQSFSELNDVEVQRFLPWYLQSVAELMDVYREDVAAPETWGDGLYLTFGRVRAAGLFALDLRDRMNSAPWHELQLRKPITLRIALHAGPVFELRNPVTTLLNYTGAHVIRCARIEPITPAGQVYASQAFAALAAGDAVAEFTCQFVKLADWAKSYGTFPTYAVQRATV